MKKIKNIIEGHIFFILENLKNILKTGFYSSYSFEELAFSLNKETIPAAIPMVSFCDIRLSQIKDHTRNYGFSGVGLTKEWGINHGINPVFYIERKTMPDIYLSSIITSFFKERNQEGTSLALTSNLKIALIELMKIVSYCKINNSQNWDKKLETLTGKKINFYNEREWRFVPQVNQTDKTDLILLNFITILEQSKTSTLIQIKQLNEKLKNNPLTFSPECIRHIIVKNDRQLNDIIKHLRSIEKYKKDFDLLVSKITTIGRLNEDH